MRRFFNELMMIAVIAVVVGLGSALFVLEQNRNSGTLVIGPWTATPDGASDNPYTAAIAAITLDLPLGAAEGIVFTARSDSAGDPLDGDCDYVISGGVLPARLWTLTVYTDQAELIANPAGRTGFHSREILRNADGGFAIAVSTDAQPGNWIPVAATELVVVLRLYDTTLTTGLAPADRALPTISAERCR